MAVGDQFRGITSLVDRLLPVESVVNLTENGPFKGPPIMHQFAPHKCVISIHSFDVACHFQLKPTHMLALTYMLPSPNSSNHNVYLIQFIIQ